MPIEVNLLVPASKAVTVNAIGVAEPLPFEFADIVCADGDTATNTFGVPDFAFE